MAEQASSSSSAVSAATSMTASRWAAFTARASRGDARVTTPAPTRSPARAARRAAPVRQGPPLTTASRPRLCLCPDVEGQGKRSSQRSGSFSKRSEVSAPRPMSATTISPHSSRPGKRTCTGLRTWKVTVSSADAAKPPTGRPVSPDRPLGRSTATVRAPEVFRASSRRGIPESRGRLRPAPNRASINSPSPPPSPQAATVPVQAARAARAAGDTGGASASITTGQPLRASSAAAT